MPHSLNRLRISFACGGLLLALFVTGCGGGSQDLARCGNGHLDSGEQCDDGNTVDEDSCTAVCQNARCGDGAVEAGVEVCDGGNTGLQTCDKLQLGGGNTVVACLPACDGYDLSVCGAKFTPTAVVPTATVTSTPTATPNTCGDGLLQPGQTCESCPADCEPAACTPSGATFTVAVALAASRAPTDAAVQLSYRSSVISIPGSGNDLTVRQRVRFAPPVPNGFSASDLDYAVQITSQRSVGLPTAADPFATVRFDGCLGSPTPSIDDLSCVVASCKAGDSAIPGCTCVVTVPAQP